MNYDGSGSYKGSFVTVRRLTVGILLSFFILDASCMDSPVVAMQAINHLNVFFDCVSIGLRWKIKIHEWGIQNASNSYLHYKHAIKLP